MILSFQCVWTCVCNAMRASGLFRAIWNMEVGLCENSFMVNKVMYIAIFQREGGGWCQECERSIVGGAQAVRRHVWGVWGWWLISRRYTEDIQYLPDKKENKVVFSETPVTIISFCPTGEYPWCFGCFPQAKFGSARWRTLMQWSPRRLGVRLKTRLVSSPSASRSWSKLLEEKNVPNLPCEREKIYQQSEVKWGWQSWAACHWHWGSWCW